VQDKAVARKLFDTIAPRFKERQGGYTRIVKIGWRRGDAAPVSLIELVGTTDAAKGQGGEGQKRRRRARKKKTEEEAAA